MQLNNLVIIPIPNLSPKLLGPLEPYQLSPSKSLTRTNSQRDDITWKKSLSAFKKFKGKKDKETKSIKNSLTHIPFLQQNDQDQVLNKNFSLLENNRNFSLLSSLYDETCKLEQTFDYFDPNHAPFFQYGVSYQYVPKQGRVQVIKEQQEHFEYLIQLKKTQSVKIKKQLSKKQKIRQQNPEKDNLVKTQKNCCSEGVLPQQKDLYEDPFIIIKARERRTDDFGAFYGKAERLRQEESRKNKIIKKTKHPLKALNGSVYSRSVYSSQNSDQLRKQESSSQSEGESNGYGNDELPIIEFDLFRHINPSLNEIDRQENGLDQLPIYELKDNYQTMAKIKPYRNSTEILQQYEFIDQPSVQGNENQQGRKIQLKQRLTICKY